MSFDFSKPFRTKTGRVGKLLYRLNDPGHGCPNVILFTTEDGRDELQWYKDDGRYFNHRQDDERDLENIPESKYKLVWHDGVVLPRNYWHNSKAEAESRGYIMDDFAGYLVQTDGKIVYEPA